MSAPAHPLTNTRVFWRTVIVAACAGLLFGMVQAQVSFTVSIEYFTLVVFPRFGVETWAVNERVLAACAGGVVYSGAGALVGMIIAGAGWMHRDASTARRANLAALGVVLVAVVLAGAAGLAYGWTKTRMLAPAEFHSWNLPPVQYLRRYICAVYMHRGLCLGAAGGLVAAVVFHSLVWWIMRPDRTVRHVGRA